MGHQHEDIRAVREAVGAIDHIQTREQIVANPAESFSKSRACEHSARTFITLAPQPAPLRAPATLQQFHLQRRIVSADFAGKFTFGSLLKDSRLFPVAPEGPLT